MAKGRAILKYSIIIIVTAIVTFIATEFVSVTLGSSVIVSKNDYSTVLQAKKLLIMDQVLNNYYVDNIKPDVLMNGALKGMASSLNDPYTVYMTATEYKSFNEQTTGEYAGIGIVVSADKDGNLVVVSPLTKDTPGAKAGLTTYDKITEVNGQKVSGKDMDKAVALMKGPAGTYVNVTVIKNKQTKPITLKIKREMITIATVSSKMLSNKMGYIRISMFDEKTADEFNKALDGLNKQGMTSLIIDLRDNPGGVLDVAASITDKLVPKGIIVYTEDRKGNREYKNSDGKKIKQPYVVLVNGGSASASEILTGAVKDYKAGTIIGTKTFGKGIVQTMYTFSDGSAFKYTVSKYYTPKGINIQKKGIMPDIVVDLPKGVDTNTMTEAQDTQLNKAIQVLSK